MVSQSTRASRRREGGRKNKKGKKKEEEKHFDDRRREKEEEEERDAGKTSGLALPRFYLFPIVRLCLNSSLISSAPASQGRSDQREDSLLLRHHSDSLSARGDVERNRFSP